MQTQELKSGSAPALEGILNQLSDLIAQKVMEDLEQVVRNELGRELSSARFGVTPTKPMQPTSAAHACASMDKLLYEEKSVAFALSTGVRTLGRMIADNPIGTTRG